VVCIATDFPGADPGESEQVYPRDLCRSIRVHVTAKYVWLQCAWSVEKGVM